MTGTRHIFPACLEDSCCYPVANSPNQTPLASSPCPDHSPAPFLGVSRLSWLLPLWASAVIGVVVEGEESEVLMDAEGVCRRARAVDERGRAAGNVSMGPRTRSRWTCRRRERVGGRRSTPSASLFGISDCLTHAAVRSGLTRSEAWEDACHFEEDRGEKDRMEEDVRRSM